MATPRGDIMALTDFSKQRALWVRALNAVGRPLKGLVHLDEQGLLEAARRRTGLSDFGEDDFRAPLSSFLGALEREAHLSLLGRILTRQDILILLSNRLLIADLFKRHPELADVRIAEPLFIMGLSRSGTSILHELLSRDPAHRPLETWEARYPCPPPEEASHDTDARIRKAHFEMTLWPRIVPAYQAMHEMGGRMPTECGDITAHAFIGDRLPALFQIPSYAAFAAGLDMKPAYEIHKKILQILQWKMKPRRWVLKAPAHMNWLDTLFDVYPDARVVQTHRDPLQIMGSTVSLISAIMWMRTERIDPEIVKLAFGPTYYEPQLYRVMEGRMSGRWPAEQIFDVRFQHLMKDPFETIRGVYSHFGWEFTQHAEGAMRSYLEHKPRGKFGKHFYSFHDLGLELATERARYERYQAHYGVESEVV